MVHLAHKLPDTTRNTDCGTGPATILRPILNVIESMLNGMARAIIHNSDHASVVAAKSAIDCYFAERNDDFQEYPRKAGRRTWGKERVDPEFNEANNCNDPKCR